MWSSICARRWSSIQHRARKISGCYSRNSTSHRKRGDTGLSLEKWDRKEHRWCQMHFLKDYSTESKYRAHPFWTLDSVWVRFKSLLRSTLSSAISATSIHEPPRFCGSAHGWYSAINPYPPLHISHALGRLLGTIKCSNYSLIHSTIPLYCSVDRI